MFTCSPMVASPRYARWPAIDVRRRRILDRDAGGHQLRRLLLARFAARGGQLRAAVDPLDFGGVADRDRLHVPTSLTKNRDEIRQVIFALRVLCRDAVHR